jgi:hypothetical protein
LPLTPCVLVTGIVPTRPVLSAISGVTSNHSEANRRGSNHVITSESRARRILGSVSRSFVSVLLKLIHSSPFAFDLWNCSCLLSHSLIPSTIEVSPVQFH